MAQCIISLALVSQATSFHWTLIPWPSWPVHVFGSGFMGHEYTLDTNTKAIMVHDCYSPTLYPTLRLDI